MDVCRICLRDLKGIRKQNLFRITYDKETFATIVMKFTSVKIFENDALPTCICKFCKENVKNAFDLKRLIERSDLQLRQLNVCKDKVDLTLVKFEDNAYYEDNDGITENSKSGIVCVANETNISKTIVEESKGKDPIDVGTLKDKMHEVLFANSSNLSQIKDKTVENELLRLENIESNLSECNESVFDDEGDFSHSDEDSNIISANSEQVQNILQNVAEPTIVLKEEFAPAECSTFSKSTIDTISNLLLIKDNENLTMQVPDLLEKFSNTLKGPIIRRNGRIVYQCDECNKSFVTKTRYLIHVNSHLGIRLYPCKICNKSFSYPTALKMHNYIHTGEKLFECKVCNKKFRTPSSVITHKQIHVEEKQFCCDKCDKRFRQNSGLKSHMNSVHNEDRPYVCEICSMRFKDLLNLKKHGLVHTNERNHPCSACEKKFKTIYALREHQKRHLGIRSHKCEVCHKAFTTKAVVKIHMRIHEGIKPYVCKVCLKQFTQIRTLQLHLRTHSNETPYHCTICDTKYRYKHLLKGHTQKHHSI